VPTDRFARSTDAFAFEPGGVRCGELSEIGCEPETACLRLGFERDTDLVIKPNGNPDVYNGSRLRV